MPYSNNGGPWGGGDDKKNGGDRGPWGSGDDDKNRPPNPGSQVPDIDDIVKKGQERLRVLMGGKGGTNGTRPGGGGGGIGRGGYLLIILAAVGLWLFSSFYSVKPEEKSVELLFGEYYRTGESGLNFAPWPVVTYEKLPVTQENTIDIGVASNRRRANEADEGLMLTGDENIVDIEFQVVWNITDPSLYLFNLAKPQETIKAVSESAMREVVGRSEFKPLLNRDRDSVSQEVRALIQTTLDSYNSGVNVVRLNLAKVDPPAEVIDAFRDVQSAEQDRAKAQNDAEKYANRVLAGARGEAAQLLQQSEAYRAEVVNQAEGDASRFKAVYAEYLKAPDVTRKRLYIETMERVLGGLDKIVLDNDGGGVVPYLPLNEVRKPRSN